MALDVYLTNACNLRCKFCFNLDELSAPQLPVDDVCRVLEAAYKQGHRYVSITGGEPFIHRKIFEVLDFAHDLGFWIQLLSHGGLLTRERIERLQRYWRLRIRISLDGTKGQTHDALRGEGTFDRTVRILEELVDSGITVGIGMTVSEHNVTEVSEMIDLAVTKNVSFVRMVPVARVNKGKAANVDTSLHEQLLERIIERSIFYLDRLDLPKSTGQTAAAGLSSLTTKRCMAGSQFFAVTSAAELLPCPLIYQHPQIPVRRFESGESFSALTRDMDALFIALEPALEGICQTCEFRSVCYGGCLAEKMSFDRGLAAEQPVCTKKILEQLSRRFPTEPFRLLVESWTHRLSRNLENDDVHACMRQAPYWSLDFQSGKWNQTVSRFH